MCGIFGIITNGRTGLSSQALEHALDRLFILSESRGREASGLAVLSGDKMRLHKAPCAPSGMVRSKAYRDLIKGALSETIRLRTDDTVKSLSIIGHSRLVTNGAMEEKDNNQPVVTDGVVGAHNGIVVNDEKLWMRFPDMRRRCRVDTEVILALVRRFYGENGSLAKALKSAFKLIQGSASVALMLNDSRKMALATNTGSLYICARGEKDTYIFASELYALKNLIEDRRLRKSMRGYNISQIKPRRGFLIDILDLSAHEFGLAEDRDDAGSTETDNRSSAFEIIDHTPADAKSAACFLAQDGNIAERSCAPKNLKGISGRTRAADSLRRCTKCILPETMPFIEFDDDGVCNYCRNYRSPDIKGREALEKLAAGHRSSSGMADCIVAFSGGRDSSYTLHYFKKILGMNPIAYTYDWGMVTDLARRNQARLCGALGIEHIIVSADIKKKRENIGKNITAWLNKPDAGMIPLFMAGDKQFFYHANRLREKTGIKLLVFSENRMERTDFKTGFCGIDTVRHATGRTHTMYFTPFRSRVKLAGYYAGQFLVNPAYLNASLPDTLSAYFSTYFLPHDYLLFYEYIRWDEKEIMRTLRDEYDWEIAGDTSASWRIGDGTAPFYNYLYYRMAGFTENDTFRSNQVREGVLKRDEALELTVSENAPRYEAIRQYTRLVGLDYNTVMRGIEKASRFS